MVKTKKKKKTKKPNSGNIFANNSVIFTIIVFILVIIGLFYHYLVPTQPETSSQVQVPSQPLHTLIEQPRDQDNQNLNLNY